MARLRVQRPVTNALEDGQRLAVEQTERVVEQFVTVNVCGSFVSGMSGHIYHFEGLKPHPTRVVSFEQRSSIDLTTMPMISEPFAAL
ncbi:hypothetical protein [Novosphingobium panipatense]|uniref:hypothetical protein n=1 Tax=Novosphingobium panipatense TaxID=428991 RepID=UPI003616D63E